MASLIERLFETLDEQAIYCAQLLALSLEKKDVVIENDITTLQKITRLENLLISKNTEAENARLELLNDLSAVYGRKPEDLTIGGLAALLRDEHEKERLRAVTGAIRESAEELRSINEQNRLLIENSLSYIDFSMNLIRETVNPEPVYYSARGNEMAERAGVFDITY